MLASPWAGAETRAEVTMVSGVEFVATVPPPYSSAAGNQAPNADVDGWGGLAPGARASMPKLPKPPSPLENRGGLAFSCQTSAGSSPKT